jgi:hypothetical protein
MIGGIPVTSPDRSSAGPPLLRSPFPRPSLSRPPLSRPKTVPIVASFLFLASGIASVVGTGLLIPNPLLDRLWKLNPEGALFFHSVGPISGVFLLALAVASFSAARGLLQGHCWAWWFAVGLFSIDLCGDIVSYFLIHDPLRTISGAMISSTFLFFLCRAGVRDYFFRQVLAQSPQVIKTQATD